MKYGVCMGVGRSAYVRPCRWPYVCIDEYREHAVQELVPRQSLPRVFVDEVCVKSKSLIVGINLVDNVQKLTNFAF